MEADIVRFYSALQPDEVLALEIKSAAPGSVCKFRTDREVRLPRYSDNEQAQSSAEHGLGQIGACLCWIEMGGMGGRELGAADSFVSGTQYGITIAPDPKNSIYAVRQILQLPIAPYYNESNSSANVSCDTFAAWLDFSRHIQHFHALPPGVDHLWPLTLSGIGRLSFQPAVQDLPSWAPDWSTNEPVALMKINNQNEKAGRRGASDDVFALNTSRRVRLTERRLEIPAVRAEWVYRLGPLLDCESDKDFWPSLMEFIERSLRGRRAGQPTTASALYRLLFWNEDHHDPNIGNLRDPRFAAMVHLISDKYARIGKGEEEGKSPTRSHENLMVECMAKLGLDKEVETCVKLLRFVAAMYLDMDLNQELLDSRDLEGIARNFTRNLELLRDHGFAELLASGGEKITFFEMLGGHDSPEECQNSARILSFFMGPDWVPYLRARPWALPHDRSGGGLSGAFARHGSLRDWTTSLRATWLPPLREEDTESVITKLKMKFRLAELMDGSLGLLPYGARSGDVVYVLSGLSVPSVIRYGVDGLAQHIGTCVVSGLMEGEIKNLVMKGERLIEILVLY